MPQYMLLLRDNSTVWSTLSPDQMQSAFERYMAWSKLPYVVGSGRLKDTGRVMNRKASQLVTDGPLAEAKEVLGGYYSITAASYEEAVELAADHPHLDFGTIEVRELY